MSRFFKCVAIVLASTGSTAAYAQISSSAPTTAKTARLDDKGKPVDGGAVSKFQRENPLGNVVRDLREKGIALDGAYVGNIAANPAGGVSQGFAESHWVDFSADLDMGKVMGLSNTHVHVRGADFEGDSLGKTNIGNSISFQQTWRPVPGWRLTQLDIEHQFGRLKLIAGRSALNTYFGASPLNCVFMSNTACLTAYGPITAIGITAFPNSSWMALGHYWVSKKVYAQVGVFDYNNDLNLAGKAGADFSFFKGSGTLIAAEAGYETSFANDRFPRRYRIGVDINTDGGTSLLYDRNGQPAGISGLARVAQTGTRIGVYALVDQTVSRPDPKSPRNLALFGRLFYNAGAKSTIDWFASAGFVKTGTFKGRDNDTIGFIISNTHFSDDEVEYLRELRVKAGGSGTPPGDEIIGELNYGFAAAPGVRLLPNVQYVINPDPIYAPKYPKDIPAAVVVGLRVDIRFAQLLTGSHK